MNSECLFCVENEKGENTFLKNDLFRARWDQIPTRPGHAEIVPLRHVQYFRDLEELERQTLLDFVSAVISYISNATLPDEYKKLLHSANDFTRSHVEQALEDSIKTTAVPDAYNHGLNDGAAAGQTIPHFHYHVIPRWEGDTENPRGGIRRMFGEDAYSNAR